MKMRHVLPTHRFHAGFRRDDGASCPATTGSKTTWGTEPGLNGRHIDGVAYFMVYVVKWIPKDQDVTIDHSSRYEHSSQALEFACNALQLSPKKIWIEGTLHTDHQTRSPAN